MPKPAVCVLMNRVSACCTHSSSTTNLFTHHHGQHGCCAPAHGVSCRQVTIAHACSSCQAVCTYSECTLPTFKVSNLISLRTSVGPEQPCLPTCRHLAQQLTHRQCAAGSQGDPPMPLSSRTWSGPAASVLLPACPSGCTQVQHPVA